MGKMRRVVVTGLGAVTPLGCSVEDVWQRLIAGDCGISRIDGVDVSDLPCKVAGQVPRGDAPGAFNPDEWMDAKEQRRVDSFIVYGVSAAAQALHDAGWHPKTYEEECETGVLIGSGFGGLGGIYDASITLHEKGPRRISPFFVPGRLNNMVAGYVSIANKLKGPNHSVVTACATGTHAIGDAGRMIALGDANVMVAGGSEALVNRLSMAGFCAANALSTKFNDEPKRASRPFDRDRDGFVIGEGAGCIVLEELEHARARGTAIYGELVGYGLSGDAFHITAPPKDGGGLARAMSMAINRAGLSASDVDYVNAHGTSTLVGDEVELHAVETAFGEGAAEITLSSTKSSIGHLLGAAGAVEAIFCILAIRDQIAPPTLNLDNPLMETSIDLAPRVARKRQICAAMSNSAGFGGTNASLIFSAFA